MVQAFDDPRPAALRPAPASGPRVPPHDLDAEESLLGAMLLSIDAASAASRSARPGDFYKPAHGHIFAAIEALFERGEPVDAVTVTDELRRSGLLEAVGDPAVLVSLQANTPSIANAGHYARIVEEHSLLRRLVGVAGEIADIGYSVPEDVTGAVDDAEQMVFDVAQRRTTESIAPAARPAGAGPRPHRGAGPARSTDHRCGAPATPTSTRSWPACSRPASPSSAPARPWARPASPSACWPTWASCSRRPALLFSLEMGHLELTQRMLASEARVDAQQLRTGRSARLGLGQGRDGGQPAAALRSSSTTTRT